MATGGDLPPWDRNNPREQDVPIISKEGYAKDIYDVIRDNAPEVIELLDPSSLWPHLNKLRVLDDEKKDDIKHNAPRRKQVNSLLDYIQRRQTWRFHALLRACALTNQGHVVRTLGFDPDVYLEGQQEPGGSQTSSEGGETVRLSGSLLRAIRAHCKACKKKLMRTKLFDFDNDPNAEVVDVSEYFIQIDLKEKKTTRRNKGDSVTIPEALILQPYDDEDSPQAARLDGAPGAGKTTFLRHLVYKWSCEFLSCKGDPITVDVGNGQFSTMVYLNVRSIKGSVREAIRNALWCQKEDKDILLKHVETGGGVAILIDGFDELRDEAIIAELKDYIDELMGESQQVLISTRTGLCKIDQDKFDRILVLQGFTVAQAMNYVRSYYPPGPPGSGQHPTLTYIEEHQQELEPILTNPLRLNILCELSSRGLLELKPGETLDVLELFRPLEKYLIRREIEKVCQQHGAGADGRPQVTTEDAEQFYRMCLFGMISGVRAFTEKHLKDYRISKIYRDAFLSKHTQTDLEAEDKSSFTFGHEMIYEFFSSLHLLTASEDNLKPLLLVICGQKPLRNVQKIACEIFSKKRSMNLLLSTIRAILLLQPEPTMTSHPLVGEIYNLQKSFNSDLSVDQLLMSDSVEHHIREANLIWDKINSVFDHQAGELTTYGLWENLVSSNTINHVVDCLHSCLPHQQEHTIRHSVHHYLPCIYTDDLGRQFSVYAAGPARWAKVQIMSDRVSCVYSWCLEDVAEVLQAHRKANPQHTWWERVFININFYQDLWGEPPESCCSQQACTSLLQLLPHQWGRGERLHVHVPPTAPLRELMACLTPTQLSRGGEIDVSSGQASLDEVENWVTRWQGTWRLELADTKIVLPSGESEASLRARRDRLCEVRDSLGKMVRGPKWITETGETYIWSDALENQNSSDDYEISSANHEASSDDSD